MPLGKACPRLSPGARGSKVCVCAKNMGGTPMPRSQSRQGVTVTMLLLAVMVPMGRR